MNDEVSADRPVLRWIGRTILVSAFAAIAGGALFSVHYINRKFDLAPAQTYVPVGASQHAAEAAADRLRSKSTPWNLYRADAGFSIAAPASYVPTFPRPSGDLHLSELRPEGKAFVRVSIIGDKLGARAFTTWKAGTRPADVIPVLTARMGKPENFRANTFVNGWFDYERAAGEARVQCIVSPELISDTPVAIEVCSTYGLEYDAALLTVAVPTTLASQKSSDAMDASLEDSLGQAFKLSKDDAPPVPVKSRIPKALKGASPAAASEATPSADTVGKLSLQEAWEQRRAVACFGKALNEMEACYADQARDEIAELQGDADSDGRGPATKAAAEMPGIDMVPDGPSDAAATTDDD
jgi:hypothetical protein